MKKTCRCIALLVGVLLIAVSNVRAQQRTLDDVLSIVAKVAAKNAGAANVFKSKSYAEKVEVLQPSSAMMKQLGADQCLALPSGAEAFYVYSLGEGEGFVIVSADERMSAVLAYADKGDFLPAEMPDNVKGWLLGYVAEAKQLTENLVSASGKAALGNPAADIVGADPVTVGPLITTEWGQNYPYNAQCPIYSGQNQAVTGCIATAMAQAMNYYGYPERGVGANTYVTTSYHISLTKDFNLFAPQWGMLKNTYLSTGNTDAEVEAIASLMFNCGVAVNMDYASESASNQPAQMAALYKYFGYDADMHIAHKDNMPLSDWHLLAQGEIEAGRPLLLSGSTPSGYGHAFILDGYTTDGDDYPYYHVNWGWNGRYNGNYKMSCMSDKGDPNDAYTENLAAIIGFKPDDGVTELVNYLQISNIDVASEHVDLSSGQQLMISFDRCINGSVHPFTGKVVVCLVNDKDEPTAVYSVNFDAMPTSYFGSEQDAVCCVPSTLPSGEYTIKAFAISQGASEMVPVTIGNKPQVITIVNDPNVFLTSLEATDMAASKTANRALKLDATGVCNFSDEPFSGTLQMMVSDYSRNFVGAFGSTRSLSGLGHYSYYSNTFTFTGTLPSDIKDGAYRLNLGANQNGYTNWTPVKRYVMEDGYITSHGYDATTKFWVVNNEVTLTPPYVAGDVNNDNSINVPDLSALIRLVLDNYSEFDKTFWAADLNDDARLNVGDYSLLVDKILHLGAQSHSYAASPQFGGEGNEAISLQLTEQNGEYLLAVKLQNGKERFNSMQFDLQLPRGLELSQGGVEMTARTRGFRSAVRDGRVLVYNLTDSDISGEEDDVVCLRLKKTGDVARGTVGLRDIVLSESEACDAVSVADAVVAAMPDDLTALSSTTLADGLTITAGEGHITIAAHGATTLRICTAGGALVKTISLKASEEKSVMLTAGVYVVGNTKVVVW